MAPGVHDDDYAPECVTSVQYILVTYSAIAHLQGVGRDGDGTGGTHRALLVWSGLVWSTLYWTTRKKIHPLGRFAMLIDEYWVGSVVLSITPEKLIFLISERCSIQESKKLMMSTIIINFGY